METETFLLEVVKVMIPLLTGFLIIFARTVEKFWSNKKHLKSYDYFGVITISVAGFSSFACWAGALASGMSHTMDLGLKILWMSFDKTETLKLAAYFTGMAYNFFVLTIFLSGIYYLMLLHSSEKIPKRRRASHRKM